MASIIISHLFIAFSLLAFSANAQLSSSFYSKSCPRLQSIVRAGMTKAVNKEKRIGASILRLFFHDCFVNVREKKKNPIFSFFIFFNIEVEIRTLLLRSYNVVTNFFRVHFFSSDFQWWRQLVWWGYYYGVTFV